MAEVNDETLALLQRSHDVLMKLNGDARTRAPLEAAIKVHYPQVVTEEDQRQQLVAPQLEAFKTQIVDPLREQLEAFTTARQTEAAARTESDLASAFTDIRKNRGFTDDGIEAVKRLMVDRSIADPHAAAALFAEQNPPAPQEAPGFQPQHWNMEQTVTDFDLKGLFENEDRWADNMAAKALNEIRVGQAA